MRTKNANTDDAKVKDIPFEKLIVSNRLNEQCFVTKCSDKINKKKQTDMKYVRLSYQ